MSANRPLKVFISYSHHDESLKEELEIHLANLVGQRKIDPWQDRMLEAGQEWEPQIKAALEAADILLLLVSPRFMASQFIRNVELKTALAKHKVGTARVIPVVLKPVDLVDTDLATLQALPRDGKPITQWDDQDAAFVSVVQGLRKVIDSIQARPFHQGVKPTVQPSEPKVHPSPVQQPQALLRQPDSGKDSSSIKDRLSRDRPIPTKPTEEQGPRHKERNVARPSPQSRSRTPKITQFIRKTWYFILPTILLWVLIGSRQKSVIDLSGHGEIFGFFGWGALGGVLNGILAYLAWQRLYPSRLRIDMALLYSLIGLITGGGLWALIYAMFGLGFIRSYGTLIGFGIGLACAGILLRQLWQLLPGHSPR